VREVRSFPAFSFTAGTRFRLRKERIANVRGSMGARITRWMLVQQSPAELRADSPGFREEVEEARIFSVKSRDFANASRRHARPRNAV
jgi:hypothetical protein